MQITVSGKQVDLSDALRTRVSDQLVTIAGKYFDHALEANVTFSRARSFFTCDNQRACRPWADLARRRRGCRCEQRLRRRRRTYRQTPTPLSTRVNEHARDLANRERPQAGRQYVLRQEDGVDPIPDTGESADAAPTIIAEAATPIGRLSVGEAVIAARPGRPAGDDVPQQRDRRAERDLPADGRPYRLDRPVHARLDLRFRRRGHTAPPAQERIQRLLESAEPGVWRARRLIHVEPAIDLDLNAVPVARRVAVADDQLRALVRRVDRRPVAERRQRVGGPSGEGPGRRSCRRGR